MKRYETPRPQWLNKCTIGRPPVAIEAVAANADACFSKTGVGGGTYSGIFDRKESLEQSSTRHQAASSTTTCL